MQVYRLVHVLLVVFISSCTHNAVKQQDLYRAVGSREIAGPTITDGIFQDFRHHNENVGKMWLDADAMQHGPAKGYAHVKPYVVRDGKEPYLRVEYGRYGYGASIMILPKYSIPELIPPHSKLSFQMRSETGACVGLRVAERDMEIWVYGPKELDYDRQCVAAGAVWVTFDIDLTVNKKWYRFPYTGNVAFGNKKREFDALTGLSLELGVPDGVYLGKGDASLEIKNILIKKK